MDPLLTAPIMYQNLKIFNPSMNNLAYDIQEPFRFLVDLSIIDLIELDKMDNKEFIRLRVILSAQTIRNKEG